MHEIWLGDTKGPRSSRDGRGPYILVTYKNMGFLFLLFAIALSFTLILYIRYDGCYNPLGENLSNVSEPGHPKGISMRIYLQLPDEDTVRLIYFVLITIIITIFKYIAGLALKVFTNCLQSG